MSSQDITFGAYVYGKRKTQGITQKQVAEALGVTTVYICDIEKNRRYPPTGGELLTKLVAVLKLSDDDLPLYYDLAGQNKGCVPPDIAGYVMSTDIVRVAIRKAKNKASVKDWQQFIAVLENK
ncbi:helix-turn-helix transcriptional regulator [Dehalobacter sp.]|uniref:helix-turn-helix domain-containing protein n=1 Tax=Dehalobacter sp. TaxID=1962289 RepID=UPI00258DFF52|nr:helix-turn-helix transcriptional regulator [Dehalobacter sp.]MDJ0304744.1 helix-turn-helix transcriptional regulator [Dehalobacter sp.]